MAIIIAILAAVVGTTTKTVALMQTVTMVEMLGRAVFHSSDAFQAQEMLNQHLYWTIHILQQQVDLLSEEIEMVQDMSLLVCDSRFKLFCLTPYQVHNSTTDRLKLAHCIERTWSPKFLNYSIIFREQIHKLNFTRPPAMSLEVSFITKVWNLKGKALKGL